MAEMKALAEELKHYWKRRGVKVLPGASPEEIEAFEARHNLRLSQELRDYFSVVNGMEKWDTDDELIEFMSLDRMSEVIEEEGAPSEPENALIFAQYSIFARVFAVKLPSDPSDHAPVVEVGWTGVNFPSFTEFARSYLADPEATFFG